MFLINPRTKRQKLKENVTSVITLTLLNPLQSIPAQSWTFEPNSVIRIGRSNDNEVILYSAVVSRHHVEIRPSGSGGWEVVSLGANGTYIDGERINQVLVVDGMIIRLASSGPKIQIRLGAIAAGESNPKLKTVEKKPSGSKLPENATSTFINAPPKNLDENTQPDIRVS